jgi:WD40 repeat protein
VRPLIATVAPEDKRIRLWDTERLEAHSELAIDVWAYGVGFGPGGQLATTGRELLVWDDPTAGSGTPAAASSRS